MEIRSHSFVIHQSEWATIEKGLIQRANLLDLIYKDIYGEQLLIKIILFQRTSFNNSGFLDLVLIYYKRNFTNFHF
jgi:uncharacterized circularly permuted ATP-grasp superfamily protein